MNTSKKKLLAAEEDVDEIVSSDTDEDKFEWTPKSIDIMLNEYKNNMDKLLKPGMPRRRIWDVVRKRLGQEGFQGVRSDICLKKFGKLKALYKDFISGRKVHRSFASHAKILKEIIEKSPPDVKSEDEDKGGPSEEDMKDCPAWFSSFIKRYLKDEEERRSLLKKFHEDIVAVETKKCQLLEVLVQKANEGPPSPPVIRVAPTPEPVVPCSPPQQKPKVIPSPSTSNGDIVKAEAVKRKMSDTPKFQKIVRKNPPMSAEHSYNNAVSNQTPVPQPSTPKPQQASLKGLSALFKNNFNHNIQVLPVNENGAHAEPIAAHDGVITIEENLEGHMDVNEDGVNELPSEIIIINEGEGAPQIQAQTDS